MANETKDLKAWRFKNNEVDLVEEHIIIDANIKLVINDNIERNFTVSPRDLKEFTIGYMLGEGFITSPDDIKEINIKNDEINVYANLNNFDTSKELILCSDKSGGLRFEVDKVEKVESNLKIKSQDILDNLIRLKENAEIWERTGGCHIAGIVYENKIMTCEDVSRHVALDKIIGKASIEKIDFNNSYIVYSGRMPADMMIKISRLKIPIVASNAAPMYSGYKIAKESNITMLGFVRGNRFNLYTCPERIIF